MQARLDFGETHMALAKQHRSSPGIHQAPSAPASPLA
jgi:hypothetical protein